MSYKAVSLDTVPQVHLKSRSFGMDNEIYSGYKHYIAACDIVISGVYCKCKKAANFDNAGKELIDLEVREMDNS